MNPRSRIVALLSLAIVLSLSLAAFGATPLKMKVTSNSYLRARGVSIMLYDDNYSPVFFDQKDAAMQIILHGHRVATNGSVRLGPTPQQWDRIPHLESRQADKEQGRLTAELSYPAFHLSYQVVVAAEPGGVRVSVNLDQPLPKLLLGRAGFNLELLPSAYQDKSYVVDNKTFGILPRYPESRMASVPPRPGTPKRVWWAEQWRKAQDYMQPLPFATGQTMTFAAGDPLDRISISSETGPLMLYDGRNLATNGWFVVRTLIPAGKTKNAVVWHIRPNYLPNWVRPPMIAHSQAGYAPNFEKIAIIGLDPRFHAPQTAELLRLSKDGSFHEVFAARISQPTRWLRYDYAKFNFSSVKQPGLYKIEYAGERTDVFPIAQDVYSHTWQTTLDCFLAVQMDHVSVKDAYHIWHGVPFMDDAVQAPPNTPHFDGYAMGAKTFSPYKPGQHIPGLNVGGWFDAGDFDNDAYGWLATIDNLSLAYTTFHMKWDELSVNEKTRQVVMHQPDGIPDAVEQVMHGVLQALAQIHAVGHPFAAGIQSPYLEDYTSVGDAASIRDDRWAWTTDNSFTDYRTAAALAAAVPVLRGWYNPLAKQCLAAAIQLWNREKAHPAVVPRRFRRFARFFAAEDWPAALELMIVTKGGEPYKQRVEQLFPEMLRQFGFEGWTAVRALPYLPPEYRTQFAAALKAYMPQLQRRLASTPFGVPPSSGAWGNSEHVADFGSEMYFLHEAFPHIVGPQYTLRAANYLLGAHPVSSVSYVAGIGTASKLKTYSANRGDHSYIPGGVIPGYVVIKPDFPECITNFGMLWFEDETTVSDASSWVLEANAAEALVRQSAASPKAEN